MAQFHKQVTEDWKREYEKIVLSRKFAAASSMVGYAFSMPTDSIVKRAFGAVADCVQNMPIGDHSDNQKKRNEFLARLDDIETVLYGNPKLKNVQKLYDKYNVSITTTRSGVKMVDMLQDLPELLKHLRNILVEAGDFATAVGLRVTLPKERKYGMERLLEEEGFEEEDIDGV